MVVALYAPGIRRRSSSLPRGIVQESPNTPRESSSAGTAESADPGSGSPPGFEGSAPAADITVERPLYRRRADGTVANTVGREPDGSLRIGFSWGHYFLAPPLTRWLEQDNTVLTWTAGTNADLCLIDAAGTVLWRESSADASVTPPPAVPHDYGGPTMGLGSRLRIQSLTSPSGSHTLLHHDGGNVVLYCNATHTPVWSTDTAWLGDSWIDLTPDGDLVLRTSCGAPVWRSGTAGRGVRRLAVRDDGSVALLDASGTAVRQFDHHAPCAAAGHTPPRGAVLRRGQILQNQSLTSADGDTVLCHRADRGARLFRADGRQVWYAAGGVDDYLTLDDEGFLQVRAGDGSVREQLAGPGDHLRVVSGGEIRLCAGDGTVVWRAGQYVLDQDHDIVTSAPRPVTPAAAAALLNAESTPIVRTDFSDDQVWETAWRDITLPRIYWEEECVLDATLVAVPEFAGWTSDELAALLSHSGHGRVLIADTVTLASAEHPVLVVELDPEEDPLRSFRATPHALVDVEIQLSLANMDWEEFSESADPDGVLRTSMAD